MRAPSDSVGWRGRATLAAACCLRLFRGARLRPFLDSLRLARSRTVVWPSTNVQCLRRSLCAADSTPCSGHAPVVVLLDQITVHLFQPHQADQMLDPQRMGLSYAGTH